MIAWGATRLVLLVLFRVADLREAHLQSQLNVVFVLMSVLYVAAGVAIWRRSRATFGARQIAGPNMRR